MARKFYYVLFACVILSFVSAIKLQGIEWELQKLQQSLSDLKNIIQPTQKSSNQPVSAIDLWFENFPPELIDYVGPFPRDLSSPAPSLRRARKLAPKLARHAEGWLHVLSINNNGDLLYGNKNDYEIPRGQRMILQRNDATQKHIQEYESYLGNDWRFYFTYLSDPGVDYQNGGISVVQEDLRMLGRFTMESGAVKIIGTYQEDDIIHAMNAQSAIVRGNDNLTSWMGGNQRIPVPYSNQFTFMNATLDQLSNRAMWINPTYPQQLFIKEFGQLGDPLRLPIGSPVNGDSFDEFCQRDDILVTSSAPVSTSGSLSSYTLKIRFHSRDKEWRPTLIVPLTFAKKTEIYQLALNSNNSLVLCGCFVSGNEQYPGVMSVKSGAFVSDELQNEPTKFEYFLFSPNGRWIAGQCHDGRVLLWEVRGFHIDEKCTLEERFHLKEFNALYEKAKKMKAQYHLTPEQYEKYKNLLSKPYCEVPDAWKTRFLPPRA